MSAFSATPPEVRKNIAGFRQQLTELPAFRALLRSVEADFYQELPMPSPILDLGCGDGHFAQVTFQRTLTIGLDPWWRPLQEARQTTQYRWLTNANGAAAPFKDDSFATIISNSVLEHIPELEPVLCEVARILKPGGYFYFCVPSPQFREFLSGARFLDSIKASKLAEAYRKLFDQISRHHSYYTPNEWISKLERAGLSIQRWWAYFSPEALTALEWGHPLGLPALLAKKLSGHWLLANKAWNIRLTEHLLKSFYMEQPSETGAYLFFVVHKPVLTNRLSTVDLSKNT